MKMTDKDSDVMTDIREENTPKTKPKKRPEDVEDNDDDEVEEFTVERVCNSRMRHGKKEYLLKWKGYAESANTWEPEENLDCPDLISEYEDRMTAKRKEKEEKKKKKEPEKDEGQPKKKRKVADVKEDDSKPRGFDRGLKPEKIIGATDSSGELMFLMKWTDCDEADLVPARQANVRCPQVVISFYEERLTWHTHNENEDDEDKNKEAEKA